MTKIPNAIEEYLQMIETEGKHLMCNEQKKLAKFIRKIFTEEELICDDERFNKYMTYQKYFPFDLLPWEKFIFYLQCCLFKSNGLPRFADTFVLVGRGSGKNGYLSFLSFCMISPTNNIKEYDIDICANSEEQAKTSFMDIWNILENPKWKDKMKKNFRWNREEIISKKTNSKIKFRTNSPKGKDGLRTGMACFDEVHQYTNWDNINVFTTGLGKKPHPRRIYITTQGEVRDAVLDEMLDKSLDILDDKIDDGGFLPFICRLDDKEEVYKEECWFKANPTLYVNEGLLEQMRREFNDYKNNPIVNKSFIDKRCNLPQMYTMSALTEYDNIKATNQPIPYEEIKGMYCTIGIDFASISDMVGVSICIKRSCKYYIISKAFMNKNSKDLPKIKAPLKNWEEMGLLEFTDGVENDPSTVFEWIRETTEKYELMIEGIAIDLYRLSVIKKVMEDYNFDYNDKEFTKLVRPSDIMLVVPLIDSLFNNHKIVVGDNPLMRWSMNNTQLLPKQNGNFVYDKIDAFRRKNDLFMSMVHSIIISDRLVDWDDF